MNGEYRRDTTHRKRANHGVSFLNHSDKTTNSESYLELDGGHMYDVQASRNSTYGVQRLPGEVRVTEEISVDSHMV